MKLITYKEFRDLAKPITAAEHERLEQNILKYGCRHPIVTWGDVIIDGHKRYAICRKHYLPFKVDNRDFRSFDDAKRWAYDHANFVAECKEMLAEDDEPVKTVVKPMLELPPSPVVPFRKVLEIDTMAPSDIKEFILGLHKRFGHDYLKEIVFMLFSRIVPCQDKDDTRRLLQQLYNLHYTPSFTERRHGTPQF